MKGAPYLGLAILAGALAGCASATSNGLPPSAPAMPPLPEPTPMPRVSPVTPTPPRLALPKTTQKPSAPSIQEEDLPMQTLETKPRPSQLTNSPVQTVTQSPSSAGAITSGNFAQSWSQDLGSARQQSTVCVGESGSQRSACWQGVARWSQARAAEYSQAARLLGGAQKEQANAAQKFFQTTSQWASACSSLSATDCAHSPLIAKMQQWKSSVGISATNGN